MSNKQKPYTLSHDPKNAPNYTHRLYSIYYPDYEKNLICFEDTDRTHYPFLRQWQGLEIDVNNQWSVNNGKLALKVVIFHNEKNKLTYFGKMKLEFAKTILQNGLRAIGICNERKKILLPIVLPNIIDLATFYNFKVVTDKFILKNNVSHQGWGLG